MNRLTEFFSHLPKARQQRELRHRREQFYSIHNSETSPPSSEPHRERYAAIFLFVYALFMLLFGLHTFGRPVISSFQSIATRERETKVWVQKLVAQSQGSEAYKRNQLIAQQVMDLETQSARASRWIMVFAVALSAPMVVVLPLLLIWVVPRNYHVLRSGFVSRAEVVSRSRWASTAKLRFVTDDGKSIETVRHVPAYVPVGTKLWIRYSQRNPQHVLICHAKSEISNLLFI
jgi:hypothetical protein